jgi:hypothetical protein
MKTENQTVTEALEPLAKKVDTVTIIIKLQWALLFVQTIIMCLVVSLVLFLLQGFEG